MVSIGTVQDMCCSGEPEPQNPTPCPHFKGSMAWRTLT